MTNAQKARRCAALAKQEAKHRIVSAESALVPGDLAGLQFFVGTDPQTTSIQLNMDTADTIKLLQRGEKTVFAGVAPGVFDHDVSENLIKEFLRDRGITWSTH